MDYVIHKLWSLSRATIHLGTHEHFVAENMCKESLEEIKVLGKYQVSCTPNPKILQLFWMQVKPYWHIICSMRMVKDRWKFFKARNLTTWWTYSNPSVLPTFGTSLHPLSVMLIREAPWITYFPLSRRILVTTSKIVVSLDKWLGKRCFYLKCHSMG
jgi:hypothetical protein